MEKLSLAHHTMFADLIQKGLDAEFDAAFAENGAFSKVKGANGQLFWYYKGYRRSAQADAAGKRFSKYVGPVSDPAVTARVEHFQRLKASYRERRSLVTSLTAVGLPAPPALVGDVVEALWKAGFFRLRGVLVGTVAFQTYAGLLGIRLRGSSLMTGDLDVAQFHSISVSVDDAMPPVLETLRLVDPSFRDIPHPLDSRASTGFINAQGFKVEFLTPNRGRSEYSSLPVRMPALGGASAQALRYLDFLIHKPMRSVLLHKGGVPVLVPAPERYAIHKLILSKLRRVDGASAVKARKDLDQAGILIQALIAGSQSLDLGLAWIEAWDRGPKWKDQLSRARRSLDTEVLKALDEAIALAAIEERRDPAQLGMG